MYGTENEYFKIIMRYSSKVKVQLLALKFSTELSYRLLSLIYGIQIDIKDSKKMKPSNQNSKIISSVCVGKFIEIQKKHHIADFLKY